MPQGTVKFYDVKKGFGFLSTEGAPDTFVHVSAVKESRLVDLPKEGECFTFDVAQGPKGTYATNLTRA